MTHNRYIAMAASIDDTSKLTREDERRSERTRKPDNASCGSQMASFIDTVLHGHSGVETTKRERCSHPVDSARANILDHLTPSSLAKPDENELTWEEMRPFVMPK